MSKSDEFRGAKKKTAVYLGLLFVTLLPAAFLSIAQMHPTSERANSVANDRNKEGGESSAQRVIANKQKVGGQTVTAEQFNQSGTLRVIGKVATEDPKAYSISIGVDGWIRSINDFPIGVFVKKGEALSTFYSPELNAFEQAYLVATERMSGTLKQLAAPGTESASARLRNRGVGEKQIQEIAATRSVPENINIIAPTDGFIVFKNVGPGQRFEKGTELYRMADLSKVWILAELAETDARHLHAGSCVTVSVPGSGAVIKAHVTSAPPQVAANSRKIQVHLEADNPGFVLRPGMLVDVQIPARSDATLSIPADALLNTGADKQVFVAKGDGRFEPRRVITGMRSDDRIQILRGLGPGEKVAASANFIVDSESRVSATD